MTLRLLLVLGLYALAGCSNDPTGAWSGSGDFQNIPSFGFLCMFEDGRAAYGNSTDDFNEQVANGPCCEWTPDGGFSGRLDGQWSLSGGLLELNFSDCDGPGCLNRFGSDDSLRCEEIQP